MKRILEILIFPLAFILAVVDQKKDFLESERANAD